MTRLPLNVPILARRVAFHGPAGIQEIDTLLDTGAVCTMIAWDVAKDIGYDPAVAPRRTSPHLDRDRQRRGGRAGDHRGGRDSR